jgi:MoaA/NifB/PqqE/SkfB family radical SAM enzyme
MFVKDFAHTDPDFGVGAYCAAREGVAPLRQSAKQVMAYRGKPWNFDLRLDNMCNLKCVICGGHSSSRIEGDAVHMKWTGEQQIERTPNRFENRPSWIKSDEILKEIVAFGSDVRYLQLAGGEPFMSRLALDWMAELGRSGQAREVSLRIFTNLQTFNDRIIGLLEPFKKIHIILSIDSTGDVYEYVRYPGKWAVIEAHASKLAEARRTRLRQVDVSINTTMSAQSANKVLSVYDFAVRHGFGVMLGNAAGPAHASTNYLPNRIKRQLEADLRAYSARHPEFVLMPQQINQIMSMMRSVDITDPAHAEAVRNVMLFINDMDASRGLNFARIQPDLVAAYREEFGPWVTETRFAKAGVVESEQLAEAV